jgi:hypothetical protein
MTDTDLKELDDAICEATETCGETKKIDEQSDDESADWPWLSLHTANVLKLVAAERLRQLNKWGRELLPNSDEEGMRHIHETMPGLMQTETLKNRCTDAGFDITWIDVFIEEVSEVLEAVEEAKENPDTGNLKEELVQLAAVCTSWAEAIQIKQSERGKK